MSGKPTLTEVMPKHEFDVSALRAYLIERLGECDGELHVQQFTEGQSNPTFLLSCNNKRYVLRKKPPGELLPSAHAVEREHRVMDALKSSEVPVPNMRLLCTDKSIIGTEFYLMDMVEGRVFHDPVLPGLSPAQRTAFYQDFIRSLAALHAINPEQIGLSDFGRPKGYLSRQISRWNKQYKATETENIDAMNQLMRWLPDNLVDDGQSAIVHGDYRPGNVIVANDAPEIKAILDWELCTLGHPLADLGYVCALYHADVLPTGKLKGLNHKALGIPTEQELVESYCVYSGRDDVPEHLFFVVFSLFRSAAIIQGMYKRGLDGNASSDKATKLGQFARLRAECAWQIVEAKL